MSARLLTYEQRVARERKRARRRKTRVLHAALPLPVMKNCPYCGALTPNDTCRQHDDLPELDEGWKPWRR